MLQTPKISTPEPVNPKTRLLESRRLEEPNFGWRSWEATLPVDVRHGEILDGRFWRLCGNRIKRGDRIYWRNESLTRFGELVCVSCDPATSNIEVQELWMKDLAPAPSA